MFLVCILHFWKAEEGEWRGGVDTLSILFSALL
jgi:hypothetical protein